MYPTLDLRKFFLYTSHIFKIINNMWANTIMSPEITKKMKKLYNAKRWNNEFRL